MLSVSSITLLEPNPSVFSHRARLRHLADSEWNRFHCSQFSSRKGSIDCDANWTAMQVDRALD
jgi:hypothetical protein